MARTATDLEAGAGVDGAVDERDSVSCHVVRATHPDGKIDLAARATLPQAMRAAMALQASETEYASIVVFKVRSKVIAWDSAEDSE
jgi:hypothetical protein